jgi:hypothetical protein
MGFEKNSRMSGATVVTTRMVVLTAALFLAGWDKQPGKSGASPDSGVYGFSGARIGQDTEEGVVGECIWIYDAANLKQVAKSDCSADNPGSFRVALKPGRYCVRGPGGNQKIEIKAGNWVEVRSLVHLPLRP